MSNDQWRAAEVVAHKLMWEEGAGWSLTRWRGRNERWEAKDQANEIKTSSQPSSEELTTNNQNQLDALSNECPNKWCLMLVRCFVAGASYPRNGVQNSNRWIICANSLINKIEQLATMKQPGRTCKNKNSSRTESNILSLRWSKLGIRVGGMIIGNPHGVCTKVHFAPRRTRQALAKGVSDCERIVRDNETKNVWRADMPNVYVKFSFVSIWTIVSGHGILRVWLNGAMGYHVWPVFF